MLLCIPKVSALKSRSVDRILRAPSIKDEILEVLICTRGLYIKYDLSLLICVISHFKSCMDLSWLVLKGVIIKFIFIIVTLVSEVLWTWAEALSKQMNDQSNVLLTFWGHMSLVILKWHLFRLIYYLWVQGIGGRRVYGAEASVNINAEAVVPWKVIASV